MLPLGCGKPLALAMGRLTHVSNGETYTLMGSTLSGPHGVVSWNCGSIEEAVGTVVGLHGGRKF